MTFILPLQCVRSMKVRLCAFLAVSPIGNIMFGMR